MRDRCRTATPSPCTPRTRRSSSVAASTCTPRRTAGRRGGSPPTGMPIAAPRRTRTPTIMRSSCPRRRRAGSTGQRRRSRLQRRQWRDTGEPQPRPGRHDVLRHRLRPDVGRLYGGGAQDNGTLITTDGKADTFFELLGGDGGWMIVDPKEAGHIFASFQYGGMYRFRNGTYAKVSPPFKPEDSGGVWMVYTTMDPQDSNVGLHGQPEGVPHEERRSVVGCAHPGARRQPDLGNRSGSPIRRRSTSGTENGGLFRSVDGGAKWSANLSSPELPGVMITRIETNPADARDVFITVANFGNSHVFRSKDGGSQWVDIDNGKLPDVPHHALLIGPDKPTQLYRVQRRRGLPHQGQRHRPGRTRPPTFPT